MQPAIVSLRGALIASWEEDLRAARLDSLDLGRGREALVFTQRFYGLIGSLRGPIQRAWGPAGHVHVVDSPQIGGPGPRISQSRLRLRNHGDFVQVELFTYAEGASRANREAGLDREIRVADIDALTWVTELYQTAVAFLQVALGVDLQLGDSSWLYEHVAAAYFVNTAKWATVGEVYRRATREFLVAESFDVVLSMFGSRGESNSTGDPEMPLTIEQLHRYVEVLPDLDNFLRLVHLAVSADQEERRVTSAAVRETLGVDAFDSTKLGRLAVLSRDVSREAEFSPDFSEWTFLPSYNVHFFRRVHTIDDFLALESSLRPRADEEGAAAPSRGPDFKLTDGSSLPDGTVTFLMTDVVESTALWIQSRASMYQAMRRHDALLTAAIEGNGGIVLKERGEGDSFFAVFLRATDAVTAAVEAQRALQVEEWPDGLSLTVRIAVLTGEADARDRDYRSPAVNRCAKLRRLAVGRQILVSESTYSIVADILGNDIRLMSVGERRLEGHDRPEQVYVVQHPAVNLEAEVAEDGASGIGFADAS